MPRRSSGSAVVEFGLVFPLFLFLGVLSVEILSLAFHQVKLERVCESAARSLASAGDFTVDELESQARAYAEKNGLSGVRAKVGIRRLPSRRVSLHEDPRPLESIELTFVQPMVPGRALLKNFMGEPLELHARAREVRL